MKDQIKTSAEYLANLCLENAEVYHGYDDDDLVNATLIFSHFLMDTLYTENQNKDLETQKEIAELTGKAIRELIKATTGKDMHLLAKK